MFLGFFFSCLVAPVVFTPAPTLYVLSVSLDTSSTFLDMFNVKSLATPDKKKKKKLQRQPAKKRSKRGKRDQTYGHRKFLIASRRRETHTLKKKKRLNCRERKGEKWRSRCCCCCYCYCCCCCCVWAQESRAVKLVVGGWWREERRGGGLWR